MTGIQVRVAPLDLPHGPRETMARLRGHGRHALLESALVMPRQAEWSYVAGPARATLYTDSGGTRLHRGDAIVATWRDPFEALRALGVDRGSLRIVGDPPPGLAFVGGWVGVLGYDLVRHIERLPQQAADEPALPQQWWMAVDQVLAHHHPSGQWWHCTVEGPSDAWPWSEPQRRADWARTVALARADGPHRLPWHAGARRQRMDRRGFERGVATIREAIAAGEVLQVNLTRREEFGFEGDAWSLYEDLAAAHPAPFAAFVEGPGFAIASCSPERFLHLRDGAVEARPIKGTVARGRDEREDGLRRQWLAASEKDRAENLMIVDLMRNDLGRVAALGSVRVPELFALEPYASVWQMVSTVRAQLRRECGVADLLRACWPPGSMTGAPKLKAMQMIEALEPLRRGFYAGSIGYLDCRGGMDLSVVIRSAVVSDGRAMVQVGGGIVADSEPAREWDETVAKGERLLGILSEAASPTVPRSSP
ncbi:MAG TPA: aminodeoxychorismate synthase component I [Albitalea sp.]|uniref:aminodeoxychorismate synthase component I n=1 Tax=Piscinibacter sp. TaxID=1903157 RepID=UPI002ED539E3